MRRAHGSAPPFIGFLWNRENGQTWIKNPSEPDIINKRQRKVSIWWVKQVQDVFNE